MFDLHSFDHPKPQNLTDFVILLQKYPIASACFFANGLRYSKKARRSDCPVRHGP